MSTLYSEELLAHANAPAYAALPEQATAKASLVNPLCGDAIEVGVRVRDGVLEAVGFVGEACAICVASASVMAQELTGQPIDAFERQFGVLESITRGDQAASKLPGSDLHIFVGLADFPSRKPCALLPWRVLERALHVRCVPAQAQAVRNDPRPQQSCPWRTIQDLRAAGEGAAVATLISVEGSSPCPLGSRMIVSTTGDFWGSVSGGCVESAVVRSALTLLHGGDPQASQLESFTIANSQAGEVGLACGGQLRVHIAIAPPDSQIEALIEAQQHGCVRVVPLTGGEPRMLSREQLAGRQDPLAKLARTVWGQGPQLFEQGDESWFIEPLCRPPRLVLVGATHIAQVLVRLATELGFRPVVVDPRAAMANRRRFPQARLVLEQPDRALPELLDERAAVVVLSHDPKLDDPALKVALASKAFYVGALGSRKTQRARLERLRASGQSEAALRRLRGPAGLPIGGQGASEIALSILAEIVATRRAKPGSGGRVGAVVLAAGCSRRAGQTNKLLHPFAGEPMIRRVVKTVLEAGTSPCLVVVGHQAERVRQALCDLPVTFVVNASYAEGMGTSIGRGVEAIANTQVDAAFIVLGDMPLLRVEDLESLRIAHCTSTRHLIIAPEAGEGASRRLGNPVLWPRRYFDELASLRGNVGAKSILLAAAGAVLRVPIDHKGVLFDVDTIPS